MMAGRRRVLIDPGHGGADPGALCQGVAEAALNLVLALETAQVFLDLDWDVHLTRYTDVTCSLEDRVALEHGLAPDVFLSVHCNAFRDPSAQGLEVWTSPGQTRADRLATAILDAWHSVPGFRLRTDWADQDPDKEAKFYVLTQTVSPAVLLECGFLTHDGDRARLLDPKTQALLGRLTAMAVDWTFDPEEPSC